jgi:hypothetical protein
VVSELSSLWGARRTHSGKVVWCELMVPEELMEARRAELGNPAAKPVSAVPADAISVS